MRISDWSSDVCSSDLFAPHPMRRSGPLHKALAIGKLHYFAGENDVLDRAPRLHRHRPCRVAAARARPAHVLAFDLAAADELRGEFRGRSEEHTYELQSLMRSSYAVFCLKKKNTSTQTS